jgi:charged multivesicular body protein 3
MVSRIFGKKPDPTELCKKWRVELRKEERTLDRNIREIDMAEAKLKAQIKERAKAGDSSNAKLLARELVNSRKAKERLYKSKAQLHSVEMHLQQQSATIRATGAMQKSAQIMAMMNGLMSAPQMVQVMAAMGREMEKAGLIDEMIGDAIGEGDDELEDAADEEVERAFQEAVLGIKSPSAAQPVVAAASAAAEEEEEEEDKQTVARLAALKS